MHTIIGEKSFLNSYLIKYTTKSEKCNIDFVMIDFNKLLTSKLWNFAMRSLNNRKCGALEAADTLRNLLYDTDSDTIVKWIDINEMRKKLKHLLKLKLSMKILRIYIVRRSSIITIQDLRT